LNQFSPWRWLQLAGAERRPFLIDLWTNALEAIRSLVQPRVDPAVHVTDAMEKTLSDASALYFLDGQWKHRKWGAIMEDVARRMRLPLEVEKTVEGVIDGQAVVGTPDFVLRGIPIDLKTVGSETWKRVRITGSPLPPHRDQMVCYLRLLDAPWGVLIYEDRDTLDCGFLVVERDDEKAETVFRRARARKMGGAVPGEIPVVSVPDPHADGEGSVPPRREVVL
jgi:hypothetical protein